MAPLLRMAATDPKKIKDSMRDNGDGTVTVRFFKENKESHSKEPAYVTVNKTVNKLAGKANVYASSSLWVQMMEKAYIEYLTQHVQVVPNTMGKNYEHSFTDINRSYSYQVLNALEGDKVYADGAQFGFALDGEAYKPGAPKAEKYADLEKKMYRFFDEHVNQKKETIILGNNGLDNNGRASKNGSYAKEHGIRTGHAYAVMGVFEKDGKQYVQVRDPYALFRSKYDDHGKLVNDQAMLSGTGKGGVSNMGTFNLEMKDFLQTFNYSLAMETSTNKEFIELTDAFIDVKKATSVSKTSKKAGVSTQLSDEFEIVDNKGNSVSKAEPKAAEDKGIGFLDDAEVIENPAKAEPNVTKSNLMDRMNFEEMDDGLEMDDDLEMDDEDPVEAEKTVEQKQEKDDSFADDFEELEKPYSDALLNALNEPGGKERMAETVKELAEDLEKTAMFFSFKNTKNFTTMRDMLNNVNKKLQGGKYVSNETLATDLTALSEAAETYANSKLESVKATIDSKKEPSLRAMHRLADAVSLMGLKDGNMDIAKGDLSYAESLQIVKDDLTGILKGNVPGMKPTAKEAAASALKAVESHVKSNQALNEEFGLVKPEMNDFLEVNNTQPTVQNASASLG